MRTNRNSRAENAGDVLSLVLMVAAVVIITWAAWSLLASWPADDGAGLPDLHRDPVAPLPDAPHCPRCPHCGKPIHATAARWPEGHHDQSGRVLGDPGRSDFDHEAEKPAILASIGQPGTVGRPIIGGPVAPDGRTEVAIDLPVELRTRNRGGSDGAGLCVFSSIGHAARWQNDDGLKEFQRFMWTRRGGGYPSKVDAMIRECAPSSRYLQYEGNSPDLVKLAIATGRMPSTTYNANHMVNTVHHDDRWACVLDNNYVGERELRWFKPQEWQRLYQAGGGGWTVVLLAPRPPAPPYSFAKGR